MAVNVGFNSAGAMTNQPSAIQYIPPSAGLIDVATGAVVPHKRTHNGVVIVTWGMRFAAAAVLAELRTIRNSLLFHTIQFTDVASVTHDIKIVWQGDPEFSEDVAERLRSFTIEFHQRPG